jgi:hypothetical protein
MKTNIGWGYGWVASLLGAIACSSTNLNDVGDLNSGLGGSAESSGAAAGSIGSEAYGGSTSIGGTSSSGGTGASAGNGTIGTAECGAFIVEGQGGEPNNAQLACPACTRVATGDVRGIAADGQLVFWIDYGTYDQLGNYQRNGRLLSQDLAGGASRVLADSLPGPEALSISGAYAYVFLDQRSEANHALGIARVSLSSCAVQPLQSLTAASWSSYRVFASAQGHTYWNWGGSVYRVADEDGASVETVVPARDVLQILADTTSLYFQDRQGIWSMSLADGAPVELAAEGAKPAPAYTLTQQDARYLYAIETPTDINGVGIYVSRLPKSGGSWQRIARTPDDQIPSQFEIEGEQFFFDVPTTAERRLSEASLSSASLVSVLASEPYSGNESWAWPAWTLSSAGVFLADAQGLYLIPRSSF